MYFVTLAACKSLFFWGSPPAVNAGGTDLHDLQGGWHLYIVAIVHPVFTCPSRVSSYRSCHWRHILGMTRHEIKSYTINLFLHRWTSWHSWNSEHLARWSWLACPIWEPDPFSSCARTDFVGGVVIELLPLISDDSVNSWDWRTSISTYCTGAWRWSRYSDSMADRGACNGVCRWALWRERLIAGKLSQMPGKKCLHHDIQHVNWCQQCKQKVKRSRKLDIFRRSDNLRAEMEVALGKAYL